MYNGLRLFKITPVESDMTELAIVENPAIGDLFLKFSQETEPIEYMFNDDKQIVYGVAMKPNTPIYRRGVNGGEPFYVFYDESGVEKMVMNFFKNGGVFNIEHGDKKIDNILLESYFAKENNDFNAPIGSWIIKSFIPDKADWNVVKGLQGFSVQGLFAQMEVDALNNNNKTEKKMSLKEKLFSALESFFATEEVSVIETAEVKVEEEVKEELNKETASVEEKKTEEQINFESELDLRIKEQISSTIDSFIWNAMYDEGQKVIKKKYGDMISAKIEQILDEKMTVLVAGMFNSQLGEDKSFTDLKSEMEALKTKLEEFGNQTIPTPSEKQEVANPKSLDSKAAKYFV